VIGVAQYVGLAATAACAGAINAVAGGGMLLAFPALVAAGLSPISANATATVALWPGSLAGVAAYGHRMRGMSSWMWRYAVASLIGGGIGGALVVSTPPERFAALVPWLVLSATVVFLAQPAILRWAERSMPRSDSNAHPPLLAQVLIATYGGYFGAGAGILMLAGLERAGIRDIHLMNGLKLWGGVALNSAAIVFFLAASLVSWPEGIAMGVGAAVGGHATARFAQRLEPRIIRRLVVVIGVLTSAWLFVTR
jgi:uncharacterized protein